MSPATLILISFVAVITLTNFALWLYFVVNSQKLASYKSHQ